jgi:UDP-glucose 4-epimerase
MKKVLITGANSYIGTSFENYVKKLYPNDFSVETVDMIDGTWREKSFSGYDAVFHVAGIAHSDSGKIKPEKAKLYYKVNTDLAIETAKKAKEDGAGQFIFMSSAIVYGESAPIGKQKVITLDTPVSPANCYGDSKVQAEKGILPLSSDDFKVVILRPPMIYGKGCKGNFNTLVKFAKKLPFFPYVKNERSMLFVENLVEFIRLVIKNEDSGIFFPQNAEYSNTSELVKEIGACYGKKVRLVKGFAWLIKFFGLFVGLINKAFGNLTYDKSISNYCEDYQKHSLLDSVKQSTKQP